MEALREFRIRQASANDAEAIKALVETVLPEFGQAPDYTTSESDLVDLEASYLRNGGSFLVAEDEEGCIVGTVGLLPRNKGAKLRKMYVSPHVRGQGLGQLLLDAALSEARTKGWREVVLETMSQMQAAIHLYERAGFIQIGDTAESPRCDRVYRKFLDSTENGST